ncbi:MAG: flagellar basal body-associated FliL family protein [Gammaproteobacteria bacterium]
MADKTSEVAQAPTEAKKGGFLKTALISVGLFTLMILSQLTFSVLACRVMPGVLPNCGDLVTSAEEEEEPEEIKPPIYLPLEPALVVSFEDRDAVRFLQVTVEVMARDEESIEGVQAHTPVIRNNLLMMMGGQTLADLTNREGKEALRQEALQEVQRILVANTGEPGVEDLYFTSFVVQ